MGPSRAGPKHTPDHPPLRRALDIESGQGSSHLSLVLLMGRQQTQGLKVFSQRLRLQSFLQSQKMGQRDEGSGVAKGCTLHVGKRRDSAEGLSGGT